MCCIYGKNVRLRELKVEDASLMLEWMHDPLFQKGFKKNMLDMTIEDAELFCKKATIPECLTNGDTLHYAITDDTDEYLGTISLKNIDISNRSAEYAISTRRIVHGRGIAHKASRLILEKAFCELKLHRIFLSVLSDNEEAIHLYERCGFIYEGEFRDYFKVDDKYMSWKWYSMLENEYFGQKITE